MTNYVISSTMPDTGEWEPSYFDDWQDALRFLQLAPNPGRTFTIEALKPKRKVARFNLYLKGELRNTEHDALASAWASGRYGKETVMRIQAEIDADPGSHIVGEMHSVIPDLAHPDDKWGRQFSVLIVSIEDE